MIDEFLNERVKLKDKQEEINEVRKIRMKILQVEYQAYRAATALISLGPALSEDIIMESEDNTSMSWFQWAVQAQQEGIPALKYLMRNHYGLMLRSVLQLLHSEQTKGNYQGVKIFFDVIASLDLPNASDGYLCCCSLLLFLFFFINFFMKYTV